MDYESEPGREVGDTGFLIGPNGRFEVRDTQRDSDLILHHGRVTEGTITQGDLVAAQVDDRRRSGIRRAHSATHILHHALQKHLGSHAQQRGSKVDNDWLRFDFTNLEPVSPALLQSIEREAITHVSQRARVTSEVLPLADARNKGAMMLFGEKYPDPVRMISMGEFSRELCGGTHLTNTSEVGDFEIFSEEGVSAGTRRIVALTGERATQHAAEVRSTLESGSKLLGCDQGQLPDAVAQLMQRVKLLRKQSASGETSQLASPVKLLPSQPTTTYAEIRDALKHAARNLNAAMFDVPARVEALLAEAENLTQQIATAKSEPALDAEMLLMSAIPIGNARVIVLEIPGANANSLRQLIDQIRRHSNHTAVFLASIAGADKINLVAGLSRDLVDTGLSAGEWVKHVAPIVGGGGGGKPDFAQAGGKHPEKIKQALQTASDYIRAALAV